MGKRVFERFTEVKPEVRDRDTMKITKRAGPGRTIWVEVSDDEDDFFPPVSQLGNPRTIKAEPSEHGRPGSSDIKSEDEDEATGATAAPSSHQRRRASADLPSHGSSRQPLAAPRTPSHPGRSQGPRAKDSPLDDSPSDDTPSSPGNSSSSDLGDLDSDLGEIHSDHDDVSDFRPTRSPSRMPNTPTPITRGRSVMWQHEDGDPFRSTSSERFHTTSVAKRPLRFYIPIRPADRQPDTNSRAKTTEGEFGHETDAARSRRDTSPKPNWIEPKNKGKAPARRESSPPTSPEPVRQGKRDKGKAPAQPATFAGGRRGQPRQARIERSVEDMPSPGLPTQGPSSSNRDTSAPAHLSRLRSDSGGLFVTSPVQPPTPGLFVTSPVPPATPGPSRPRPSRAPTKTPRAVPLAPSPTPSSARSRNLKRSRAEFEVPDSWQAEQFVQKFVQGVCVPMMTKFLVEAKAEGEALEKRIKTTEQRMAGFTSRDSTQQAQLDGQRAVVRNLSTRMTDTDRKLDDHSRQLDAVKDSVKKLEERAGGDHDDQKRELEEVKQLLVDLTQRVTADRERTENLAKRVMEDREEKTELQQRQDRDGEKIKAELQNLKDTVSACLKAVQDQQPERARPPHLEPRIREVRPREYYDLSRRNGLNPPRPATIPDTLVRRPDPSAPRGHGRKDFTCGGPNPFRPAQSVGQSSHSQITRRPDEGAHNHQSRSVQRGLTAT